MGYIQNKKRQKGYKTLENEVISEELAQEYFISKGYDTYIPYDRTAKYDLVIKKKMRLKQYIGQQKDKDILEGFAIL